MTYGYTNHEVEKNYKAMTLVKSELCVGWFHEKFYLVGGDESFVGEIY